MAGRGNRRELERRVIEHYFGEALGGIARADELERQVSEEIKKDVNQLDIKANKKALIRINIAKCIEGTGDINKLMIDVCEHTVLFQHGLIRNLIKNAAIERQEVESKANNERANKRPERLYEAFKCCLLIDLVPDLFGKSNGFSEKYKKADIQEALAKDVPYSSSGFKTEYSRWLKTPEGHVWEAVFINCTEAQIEESDRVSALKEYVDDLLETAKEEYPTLLTLLEKEK